MSAFIPHHRPQQSALDTIPAQNALLPALSIRDFREKLRVDDQVSDTRTRAILEQAQAFIDAQLVVWLSQQNKLTKAQSALYQMAVYHLAKGFELEHYRDSDTTEYQHRKINGIEYRISSTHQRSRECLRLLMNKPRATIALI